MTSLPLLPHHCSIVWAPWPSSSSDRPSSFPSQALAPAVPSAWHNFHPVSPWLGLVYHARFICLNSLPLTSPCLHLLQKINLVLNSDLLVYYVLFHWNISSMKYYKKRAPVLSGAEFPEPAYGLAMQDTHWGLTGIHLSPVCLGNSCTHCIRRNQSRELSDSSQINSNPGSSDSRTFALDHWGHCFFLFQKRTDTRGCSEVLPRRSPLMGCLHLCGQDKLRMGWGNAWFSLRFLGNAQ